MPRRLFQAPQAEPNSQTGKAVDPLAFDADRAFSDLKRQVEFGPRVPGQPGHARCREFLLETLNKLPGVKAARQDFSRTIRGKRVDMSNIVARINPDARRQVLLCAHWDTRPSADEDPDPDKRNQPIPGANDGASGVAVLLEVARTLSATRPGIGVQVVLFDGEDYGPELENMFLGAEFFAKNLPDPKPAFGILIDMIGDRDLQIYRERNSDIYARNVNDRVFAAAASLKLSAFRNAPGYDISDDHLALNRAGVPTVDLIDFDYAPWHTLADTPDKCAPSSLKAVGQVLLKVVADESAAIRKS
jgi:glutaminyl-peptide cyclotransferase